MDLKKDFFFMISLSHKPNAFQFGFYKWRDNLSLISLAP